MHEKPAHGLKVAASEGRFEEEGWRIRKDGTQFWANVIISAIRDEAGELRGFSKVTRDMTPRKRSEEKLREIATALEKSNADLRQFAYVASHDLQEPLRVVTSYVQLLERNCKGRLDEDADRFIERALSGVKRMQTLITDLLAYARVGTEDRKLESVDCAIVFEQTLANLEAAIKESAAVVTRSALPTLLTNGTHMAQLFQNLIANAIKFRGAGPPQVHVAAEQREHDWLFSVRDNGIGIEAQYAERIFLIFQRLHSRSDYPGTGIGLAICKKIVESQGGRIWFESEPGNGSTFWFTIPLRRLTAP